MAQGEKGPDRFVGWAFAAVEGRIDAWVTGPSGKLVGAIERVARLDGRDRDSLWSLFSAYYADVSREAFERDLHEKPKLIVLRDSADRSLQGFSTVCTYERAIDGRRFHAIFSGDTIVAEPYWGQNALTRTFVRYLASEKLRHPFTPVYWFLISKGYKTYLLLTRNSYIHYPRWDRPTPAREQAIIDLLAHDRYGSAYQNGVIRFDTPKGRLKEGIAPIDTEALQVPDIRFFVQQNPGHAKGDELCCIGHITFGTPVHFMAHLISKLLRAGVRRLWAFRTASS